MKNISALPVVAFAFAMMPLASKAAEVSIPPQNPLVKITIPEKWASEELDLGIACESEDGSAMLFLELIPLSKLEALVEENVLWLVEQGVTLDEESTSESTLDIAGVEWGLVSWDAASETRGDSDVGFLLAAVGERHMLTITYWFSKEARDTNYPDVEKMLTSVTPIEAAILEASKDKIVNIPPANPLISMTAPVGWIITELEYGFACESEDNNAIVLLEVTKSDDVEALITENVEWIASLEVVINKASEAESEFEADGIAWSRISWDAESEESGPSDFGFLFTTLDDDHLLTVTFWITKAGRETIFPDFEKILGSINKAQ